jgi:ribonuclease-3
MPSITSSDVSLQVPEPVADSVDSLRALEAAFDYRFTDIDLLNRAMLHRSWQAENDAADSNERLEFLGDAVLGWVVADIAYRSFNALPEGRLTDLRKSVVNATALADLARQVGLGEALLLGKGEAAAGGNDKTSILSDAFEAVIGAVYLDGGAQEAYRVVERLLLPAMNAALPNIDRLDSKTVLQEIAARLGREAPVYTVESVGPDHDKTFTATVRVGDISGVGVGRSKKAAEQIAADIAARLLEQA